MNKVIMMVLTRVGARNCCGVSVGRLWNWLECCKTVEKSTWDGNYCTPGYCCVSWGSRAINLWACRRSVYTSTPHSKHCSHWRLVLHSSMSDFSVISALQALAQSWPKQELSAEVYCSGCVAQGCSLQLRLHPINREEMSSVALSIKKKKKNWAIKWIYMHMWGWPVPRPVLLRAARLRGQPAARGLCQSLCLWDTSEIVSKTVIQPLHVISNPLKYSPVNVINHVMWSEPHYM